MRSTFLSGSNSPPPAACLALGWEQAVAPSLRLRPLEAPPVEEPRGGWPRWEEDLPPEHEACGSAGFIFCPGAGMWKRQGQLEKVWPWAESQSRPSRSVILAGHPRLCSLPPSSASPGPGSL